MAIIYQQNDTSNQYDFSDLNQVKTVIESASNLLVGVEITSLKIWIGKATQSTVNGTGTITVTFINSAGVVQATMGTLDLSTVTSSTPALIEFADTSYTPQNGDAVNVHSSTTSGGTGFRPAVYTDVYVDSYWKTYYYNYATATWVHLTNNQLAFQALSGSAPSSGGTRLPPPPLIARF